MRRKVSAGNHPPISLRPLAIPDDGREEPRSSFAFDDLATLSSCELALQNISIRRRVGAIPRDTGHLILLDDDLWASKSDRTSEESDQRRQIELRAWE
jgi:hypothetical protein